MILILYTLTGLLFTIFRSNAHYDYFILKEESLENNGKSYWENRCIEENKENPLLYAQWCVDGFGNFYITEPNRFSWYFLFYSKKPLDLLTILVLWPIHFFGIELIKFRSVGYGW